MSRKISPTIEYLHNAWLADYNELIEVSSLARKLIPPTLRSTTLCTLKPISHEGTSRSSTGCRSGFFLNNLGFYQSKNLKKSEILGFLGIYKT